VKRDLGLELDPATSARLGRIPQRDTKPELLVRRIAAASGLHFRVKNRDLPGSPDLANRTRRWAVFVHGCYWHSHENCVLATVPKRNRSFWVNKFEQNRERDARAVAALRSHHFRVVTIWQCELKNLERIARRLERLSR
jgi:DNA mismatch endonuclease (patch repair protein)